MNNIMQSIQTNDVSKDVLSASWVVAQDVPLLPANVPVYRQPSGRASVLQDKLNDLLKMALKVRGDEDKWKPNYTSYITLTAIEGKVRPDYSTEPGRVVIECWDADGFVCVGEIGAKVETPFRFSTFPELAKLVPLLAPERVDFRFDPNDDVLELKCGTNTTRLKCFAGDEIVPAPAIREALVLTPEQKAELDWLKKAARPKSDDSRPALRYAHVADGVAICGDGYRFHASTLHTDDLPEWIDLHNVGQPDAGCTFPDILPFLSAKGETVAVKTLRWKHKVWNGKKYVNKTFENSLLVCVKTTGKGKDDEIELTTDEQTGELVVSGKSGERSTERRIAYAGSGFIHSQKYNCKYLLDALVGMGGETVWVTAINVNKDGKDKSWLIISDHAGHTAMVGALL